MAHIAFPFVRYSGLFHSRICIDSSTITQVLVSGHLLVDAELGYVSNEVLRFATSKSVSSEAWTQLDSG